MGCMFRIGLEHSYYKRLLVLIESFISRNTPTTEAVRSEQVFHVFGTLLLQRLYVPNKIRTLLLQRLLVLIESFLSWNTSTTKAVYSEQAFHVFGTLLLQRLYISNMLSHAS